MYNTLSLFSNEMGKDNPHIKTADVRLNGMASCDILSSFLSVCLNFIVNKDYSSHM